MTESILKETKVSKAIGIVFLAVGIYVVYKNYKKENFWNGFLASMLIGGATVKIYDKVKS